MPKFKTNHRWSRVSSELSWVEVSRLFLDHGTRVEVSRTTLLVSKCLEIGAEVSQIVLMPKCLVAEVSGNHMEVQRYQLDIAYRFLSSFSFMAVDRVANVQLKIRDTLPRSLSVFPSPSVSLSIFFLSRPFSLPIPLPFPFPAAEREACVGR